jgi:metal-responsive CopG/Arc/MetJ family transcriptional regulator
MADAPLTRDMTIPITLTLHRALVARLDQLAAAEERSRSQVARRLLREALAEQARATDQEDGR